TVLVLVTVRSGPTTVDGTDRVRVTDRVRDTVVVVVETSVTVVVVGLTDPVVPASPSPGTKTSPTTRAPRDKEPPVIAKARFALRRANLPWSVCCRFTRTPCTRRCTA